MARDIHLIATENQRPNESIVRRFDTTALGGSPTSPIHDCRAVTANASTDASSKLTGSPSVSGDYVVSGALSGLVDGQTYHQIIKFTIAGNVLEYYWQIICTDQRAADS